MFLPTYKSENIPSLELPSNHQDISSSTLPMRSSNTWKNVLVPNLQSWWNIINLLIAKQKFCDFFDLCSREVFHSFLAYTIWVFIYTLLQMFRVNRSSQSPFPNYLHPLSPIRALPNIFLKKLEYLKLCLRKKWSFLKKDVLDCGSTWPLLKVGILVMW